MLPTYFVYNFNENSFKRVSFSYLLIMRYTFNIGICDLLISQIGIHTIFLL